MWRHVVVCGVAALTLGCRPGTNGPPPEAAGEVPDGVTVGAQPPQPVLDARRAWALGEDMTTTDVEIVSYERVDWPDACLGVARDDELCAQVITPGWRVTLAVDGEVVQLHTDEDASEIRRAA